MIVHLIPTIDIFKNDSVYCNSFSVRLCAEGAVDTNLNLHRVIEAVE